MSRICSVCVHPDRLAMERKIVEGCNLSQLAQDYQLDYQSVWNHSNQHVTKRLSQAMEKQITNDSFDLLTRIDGILTKCRVIFERNYENKKDVIALKALDSERSTIDLLAKISYSLHQAKLAEIELLRLQNGENEVNENIKVQENLTKLTNRELIMFQKLQHKILTGSETVILADRTDSITFNSISNSV